MVELLYFKILESSIPIKDLFYFIFNIPLYDGFCFVLLWEKKIGLSFASQGRRCKGPTEKNPLATLPRGLDSDGY